MIHFVLSSIVQLSVTVSNEVMNHKLPLQHYDVVLMSFACYVCMLIIHVISKHRHMKLHYRQSQQFMNLFCKTNTFTFKVLLQYDIFGLHNQTLKPLYIIINFILCIFVLTTFQCFIKKKI